MNSLRTDTFEKLFESNMNYSRNVRLCWVVSGSQMVSPLTINIDTGIKTDTLSLASCSISNELTAYRWQMRVIWKDVFCYSWKWLCISSNIDQGTTLSRHFRLIENMSILTVVCLFLVAERVSTQTPCSNFETGIDRPGPWYAHIQTSASIDACCALCNAEGTRCQSWIFVRPGIALSAGCYLRENVPSINPSSTCGQFCTSGFKSTALIANGRCAFPGGVFELGVDRPGNTYVRLTSIANHPACCALCQLEGEKCRAWTFIRQGAPGKESGCSLKNQVSTISTSPCVACTSGTK